MESTHDNELPADFKLMRHYDANWNAPRLIAVGAVWLAIALGVIYSLASWASPD